MPTEDLALDEGRALLTLIAAKHEISVKHLPGLHDQSTHGRRKPKPAASAIPDVPADVVPPEPARRRSTARDLRAADERLISERLQRYGGERLRTERSPEARALVRQATVDLARDRAKVLAEVEENALVNEELGESGSLVERLDVSLEVNKLTDDPRLTPLKEALASRDRNRVLKALANAAKGAGLTRIGGDPKSGPDQLIPFDRSKHRNLTGEPLLPGRKVFVLRPGYMGTVDGEDVVLEPAVVFEATPEEVRKLEARKSAEETRRRKHLPGQHDQDAHGHGGTATLQFRELTSGEALAMQRDMLKAQPWTQNQEDALGEFSSDSYKLVNGLLRGTIELDAADRDEYAQVARDANAGMRPTTEDIKVFRKADFAAFGVDPDDTAGVLALEGTTRQDRGLVSASIDEAAIPGGRGGVDMEIEVPAGTPAAYIESISDTPDELEWILGAGLHYEILSAVEGRGGTVKMKMRVVVP